MRNKAGVAGNDGRERERFHSYGSATADGLRALVHCGLGADHLRVSAARRWLDASFSADTHPGTYTRTAEQNRHAIYFYYCASVARTLRLLRVTELRTNLGKVVWAQRLTDELTRQQLPDGSWSNPAHAFREDDPIGATALATWALGNCRP